MPGFALFTATVGIVAGLLQLLGYFFYSKKITQGRIRPNTASWSIWAFGAVLESSSYVGVTGDWAKNVLPILCALSAIVLFFVCLHRGHFGKITNFEWVLIVLDCIAIFVWWWYQSAVYANILLVCTAFISFVPMIVDVWNDPMVEDALPWFIWTAAYGALTATVLLRWEKWEDLLYPLVFIVLHFIIGLFSLDRRVPKTLRFKPLTAGV